MKLAIVSQNIQGLNSGPKTNIVPNYFRNLLRDTDIICLQELKLRGSKLQAIQNLMWAGAKFYGVEAQVVYNNDMNMDGVGSGGVGTWIAPQIAHLIHSSG